MIELKIGQEIEMEFGGKAKVIKALGAGGQGIVYLVEFNGTKWALKWYDVDKMRRPKEFRRNIQQNITDGAPSNKFLWPKYLTKERTDGAFGYLMELKPDSFDTFVDILNTYKLVIDPLTGRATKKAVRFSSLYAMVTTVINIVNAFRQLHRVGKSYQDLNDGGFFINTDTGAVLVCDCDNIAPDGSNFGIGGKPGYMAPEVVRGIAKPNVQTDKYSLAVVLFKLLFRGDPMEGEKVVKDVCLTESSELKHYGQNAVFVYDPNDASNRPVRGIHDNVIKFWRLYPDYIREAFITSFTSGISDPNKRIIENEWQKLFIRLRSEIIMCGCGRTNFTSMYEKPNEKTYRCPRCGMEFATLGFNNREYRMPLYVGCRFYECEIDPNSDDFLNIAGELVENKLKPGVLGIKNCSDKSWRAKMPNGQMADIAPGKGFPIWQGLEIEFGGGVVAKI
ncbi:Protein kinase domain-containing protein [Ruminococcus sp. YE71]|uniref:protein kinase n=1 Tax=unclassified Ruminococcus TaxID=2608920 RepID=UPI00088BE394|nr:MULTISPECIES: protein kinase [unclassified Ruminococcus]SDA22098.1 Protein kinase domain-containing protein [Ruminococcus sp. YE78]SFW37431.1 Protein kinase domain-containing protein [Ruminococcus sp. YE71]